MKAIQGMFPPIVTAFKANGDIDEQLVAAEMDFALRAGVQGLSVAGSTGEGPTLCDEELRDMVQLARERAGDERPVICGVMRGCTRDAVRAGKVARDAGADALMITPTAYNVLVPDEQGMFDFYSTLSRELETPIIIYNVIPQNTITPRLFHRLLNETEHVMGIKQSVGGVPALYAMKMEVGDQGRLYAATDDMLATCYTLGACGAISAVVAAFPAECVEMWTAFNAGDLARAYAIQDKLYKPWQCIAGNQFPIRLKYALKLLGRDTGYCRSPITHLSDEEKHQIERAFENWD